VLVNGKPVKHGGEIAPANARVTAQRHDPDLTAPHHRGDAADGHLEERGHVLGREQPDVWRRGGGRHQHRGRESECLRAQARAVGR
jgi:hypothetical protein